MVAICKSLVTRTSVMVTLWSRSSCSWRSSAEATTRWMSAAMRAARGFVPANGVPFLGGCRFAAEGAQYVFRFRLLIRCSHSRVCVSCPLAEGVTGRASRVSPVVP